MTGKDFLTLLLVNYGFKEIEIKTYKGEGGAQGYDIDAYNKEYDEQYHEVNCEGLMYNITHIICTMQELGIEPTYNPFPGYDYPIKDILNMFSENKNKWNWQSKKRIKL
jgi:hypothetical protein